MKNEHDALPARSSHYVELRNWAHLLLALPPVPAHSRDAQLPSSIAGCFHESTDLASADFRVERSPSLNTTTITRFQRGLRQETLFLDHAARSITREAGLGTNQEIFWTLDDIIAIELKRWS